MPQYQKRIAQVSDAFLRAHEISAQLFNVPPKMLGPLADATAMYAFPIKGRVIGAKSAKQAMKSFRNTVDDARDEAQRTKNVVNRATADGVHAGGPQDNIAGYRDDLNGGIKRDADDGPGATVMYVFPMPRTTMR
jgi:hypothetical protein